MKKYLHIFAIASLLFTGCYDSLSEQTQSKLQDLKDQDIATIEQQVKNITTSLSTIQTLSSELSRYIEILQGVSTDLEADYESLTKALEAVKTAIQGEIDGASDEMLAAFGSAKTALEAKLLEIDTVISALKQKQADLDSRADALRKSLTDDYATAEWVDATFATLDSQAKVAEDVATIKAHVDELTKSLDATEKEITDLLEQNLSSLQALTDEALKSAVEGLTYSYEAAIDKASEEVSAAFDEALKTAISDSEEKLKGWVSEKLAGYVTLGAAEGYINAFLDLVGTVPEGKEVQAQIEALQAALEQAKSDLTSAYEVAISTAIEQSGKDLDQTILEKIGEVTADIEKLAERVTSLESEVINLRTKVTELQRRINTIDGQIAAINKSLEVLSGFHDSLEEYIGSVQKTLEDSDTDYYNETKGFIDALQEAADAIQDKIDSLSSYVGTLPEGVTDDVVTWAQKTMSTVDQQFDLYMATTEIGTIKSGIDQLISEHKIAIETDSTTLSTLIDDAKGTIDGWIDEDLTPYHSAAVVKGKIDSLRTALKGLIDTDDSDIHKSLNKLNRDYEKAVSDFQKEYKDSLATAITENQGFVDDAFKAAVKEAADSIAALKGRADIMDADISQLKKDIAAIKSDVAEITSGIGDLEDFIKESGYNSLQEFVDYVNGELGKCSTKFARIGQVDTLKTIIYGPEGDGSVSGLKFWVDQMGGLTTRLRTAETETAELEGFLAGFGNGETLVGELNKIKALLKELKDEVDGDGTDTKPGLQDMIDSILEALYGTGTDRESATEGSICYLLDQLQDNTLAVMFHSISYIPMTADGSVSAGSVTLQFFVDPAELVTLLDTDNCSLTNGTITAVSGSDGVLTVTASGVKSGWTALCVEVTNTLVDSEGEDAEQPLEFISQYIRVN